MGRGNTMVRGKYEGLYYVDRDFLDVYFKDNVEDGELLKDIDDLMEWTYDDLTSQMNFEYFVDTLIESLKKRFPSFKETKNYYGTILKNNLFEVYIEDNEWSYAVELIQVEADYDEPCKDGLQKKHYENYLKGIRECLFEQFSELGVYDTPWTHGIIYREESAA